MGRTYNCLQGNDSKVAKFQALVVRFLFSLHSQLVDTTETRQLKIHITVCHSNHLLEILLMKNHRKCIVITEIKFLKLCDKSTERRLKQPSYQRCLLKKMITSSSNDIVNDYALSKKQKLWAFRVLL